MSSRIPVHRPQLPTTDEVAPYLAVMDKGRQYTNGGPLVRTLEERYARFLNVRVDQVVVASSGTLCLEGAAAALGKTSWVAPGWTFAASVLALLREGVSVHVEDVDPATWALPRLEEMPHGIMHVVPFGSAPNLASQDDGNTVVIDAAASLGNEPDLSALPESWAVVFSLHATKILGCGEGGLAVFGSPARAALFRRWLNFGFSEDRRSESVGTNAKMSEVSAAYAHAALDRWPLDRNRWHTVRECTQTALADVELKTSPLDVFHVSPYWIVQLPTELHARDLEVQSDARGIETRRWWPCDMAGHESVRLSPRVTFSSDLPFSRRLADQTLGLPMSLDLSETEVTRVANVVRQVLQVPTGMGSSYA